MEPTAAALPVPDPAIKPNKALAHAEIYAGPPLSLPSREFKIVTRRLIIPVSVTIADIKVKSMMASMTLLVKALIRLSFRTAIMLCPLKAAAINRPNAIASAMLRFRRRFHPIIKNM